MGISENASARALQRAFKRLALRHHPDRSQDPDAPARFRRVCEAHAILSGTRAPAPSRSAASARAPSSRPPWQRADEAEEASSTQTFLDGEPIHYPTPEELDRIGKRWNSPSGGSSGYWWLLGVLAVLGILTLLEYLSGRTPTQLDPYREEFRRNLGKRF